MNRYHAQSAVGFVDWDRNRIKTPIGGLILMHAFVLWSSPCTKKAVPCLFSSPITDLFLLFLLGSTTSSCSHSKWCRKN